MMGSYIWKYCLYAETGPWFPVYFCVFGTAICCSYPSRLSNPKDINKFSNSCNWKEVDKMICTKICKMEWKELIDSIVNRSNKATENNTIAIT